MIENFILDGDTNRFDFVVSIAIDETRRRALNLYFLDDIRLMSARISLGRSPFNLQEYIETGRVTGDTDYIIKGRH